MKLKTLAEKYNYTCCYCHQKFDLEMLSREHFRKINDRRADRGKAHYGEVILACKPCNIGRS